MRRNAITKRAVSVGERERALFRVIAEGKRSEKVNYQRRMYAIVRRYTPEAVLGERNECFGELTGLRRFFRMTYEEIADSIVKDLESEIGGDFGLVFITSTMYGRHKNKSAKEKSVRTYSELNKLFVGASFVPKEERRTVIVKKQVRLSVPFLGKVK